MHSVTAAGAKRAGAAKVSSGTCSITGAGVVLVTSKRVAGNSTDFSMICKCGAASSSTGVGGAVAAQVAASVRCVTGRIRSLDRNFSVQLSEKTFGPQRFCHYSIWTISSAGCQPDDVQKSTFPQNGNHSCPCRTNIQEDAIFCRMSYCKFLSGNPCKAIATFYHWDFYLWDFGSSMVFAHSAA